MVVLLANFCQNLTYSKDASWAGVTHKNTQIGKKRGSGCFPTPRFPSSDLESRIELWNLGKPWWRGLKRSHHILRRRLVMHINICWASQFMGTLWVWNTERGHSKQRNWWGRRLTLNSIWQYFATAPSLQELVSQQLCRGSNLHKDNDSWAKCRPVSADLLYTILDTWWAQLLVVGSGQLQDKQPREPKSEPTTKNLMLENSNIA